MEDDCALGHSWECFSGDLMVCIYCDTEGEVRVMEEEGEE
jgi:hypothetical protein